MLGFYNNKQRQRVQQGAGNNRGGQANRTRTNTMGQQPMGVHKTGQSGPPGPAQTPPSAYQNAETAYQGMLGSNTSAKASAMDAGGVDMRAGLRAASTGAAMSGLSVAGGGHQGAIAGAAARGQADMRRTAAEYENQRQNIQQNWMNYQQQQDMFNQQQASNREMRDERWAREDRIAGEEAQGDERARMRSKPWTVSNQDVDAMVADGTMTPAEASQHKQKNLQYSQYVDAYMASGGMSRAQAESLAKDMVYK